VSDPEGLSDAVASGDRRRGLEALRRHLAATIEDAEPREVAALARQLTIVLKELDDLPAVKGRSTFDDLAARRRDRKPEAASS